MGFGLKIKNGIDKFGKKANNAIDKIGKKANGAINKLDNVADKVIEKSGGVTDALRVGAKIGNQIIHGINESGLRDVPVVGSVASALESGSKQLSRGATKLDEVRDKVQERKDKLANDARNRVGKIQGQAREFI